MDMETSVAVVAIMGMVVSFGLPLLLVAIILYYKHRKLRMTHATIAALAEKGLPVPPELLDPPRKSHAGLRGGLVLVALGIIAFLATGKTHKADNTPPTPTTNTAVNTPAAPLLPPAAAPRAPAETTGSATTAPADTTNSATTTTTPTTPSATTPMPDDAPRRQ